MANIKSAKKRIKIAKTRQARNKQVKSMTKMYLKKIEAAVSSKDKATATTVLNDAIKNPSQNVSLSLLLFSVSFSKKVS